MDGVRKLATAGGGSAWVPVIDSTGAEAVVPEAEAGTKYLCSPGDPVIFRAVFTLEEWEVEQLRPGGGWGEYYLSAPRMSQREIEMFKDGSTQCVVAMSGWVFAGEAYREDGGIRLENAVCVRWWGTQAGLGQLRTGITSTTICDAYGTVRMPINAVVALIELDAQAWAPVLAKGHHPNGKGK